MVYLSGDNLPSALTLLVGQQEGHPACKNGWWDTGVVMCLGQGADLYMAQLIPLPLTISCSRKSRLILPFWCRLTRVVPDKIQEDCKTVVCVCVWQLIQNILEKGIKLVYSSVWKFGITMKIGQHLRKIWAREEWHIFWIIDQRPNLLDYLYFVSKWKNTAISIKLQCRRYIFIWNYILLLVLGSYRYPFCTYFNNCYPGTHQIPGYPGRA